MTLKIRFTLVGLGIVVFLIISPMVFFFARGFKIDWENKAIIKTGTLVAKTEPKQAIVTIDGKEQQSKTPATLRFLYPKDYQIEIAKAGYQTWKKTLSIKPQLVTWANLDRDFVTLFLHEPIREKTFRCKGTIFSQRVKEVLCINDNEITIFEPETEKNLFSFRSEKKDFSIISKIIWDDFSLSYERLKTLAETQIFDTALETATKIQAGNNRIAFLANGSLSVFDPNNKVEIIDSDVSNFDIDQSDLWYIKNSNLYRYNFSRAEKILISNAVPKNKSSQIFRFSDFVFMLIDADLYQLNDGFQKIASSVSRVYWNNQDNLLVYGNNNEFSIYKPLEVKTRLVTRSLAKIEQIQINEQVGYTFYLSEGKIYALELEDRGQKNLFPILNYNGEFIVTLDAKYIFLKNGELLEKFKIR